ncbi:hypothetical protein L204_105576 [Cryptococcus depauperatus]|nr:hypothetical protein L204_02654 [Cryptococcus depauperatus CBS 7855]
MRKDKGKGKANQVDETTRLLGELSATHSTSIEPLPTHRSHIRSFLYNLLTVVISLFLSFLVFFILLASSFKPSSAEIDVLSKTAVEFTPPTSVSVLNVSDAGILFNVSLRCGIDADRALGVQGFYQEPDKQKAIERGDRGTGVEWWESLRRKSAHWFVGNLKKKIVRVRLNEGLYISPHHFDSPPLGLIKLPEELEIPLVSDVPAYHPEHPDLSWLEPISFMVLAKPIAPTGDIWDFIRRGWMQGSLKVVVGTKNVEAGLKDAEGRWWGRWLRMVEEDVVLPLEVPIPVLPGLPHPGHRLDLSNLVNLKHFSLASEPEKGLTIHAFATMPNFVRHFNLSRNLNITLPFSLPFSISLPNAKGDSKMAEVILEPITINQSDTINLKLDGIITANLDAKVKNDISPLSLFLQNYLHGLPSPIHVHGLSSYPYLPPLPAPMWLLSTFSSLLLKLSFPGPSPPPKVIRSVTIEKMSISEQSGNMKASGIVVAELELPEDMWGVDLSVRAVKPNVLVYDGSVPEDEENKEAYPPKAFGRIQPRDFLDASTTPSSIIPYCYIVRAPFTNIDLDILPGRNKVLSDFVTKVVFKGGAVAGVKGTSDVKIEVKGIIGEVVVEGLPVRGQFWVGKQRVV